MREAAVAIEKKAVERAIRPPPSPGARSATGSSDGSNASAARTAASSASAASSSSGVLGVSNPFSVAIVGGRPGSA